MWQNPAHSRAAGLYRLPTGAKICTADIVETGSHHHIGLAQFKDIDAASHDREGLQQDLQGIAGAVALGGAGDIDRDDQFGAHLAGVSDRYRRDQSTIHIVAAGNAHWLKQGRHGTGGAHCGSCVPALEQYALASTQVSGHNAQRKLHLLNQAAIDLAIDIARQRLTAQQTPAEKRQGPVGKSGFIHGFGQALQLGSILAAGIKGSHQTAGRGTGDQVGANARLLQNLDHTDMGEPARRPPAQGQAYLWQPLLGAGLRLSIGLTSSLSGCIGQAGTTLQQQGKHANKHHNQPFDIENDSYLLYHRVKFSSKTMFLRAIFLLAALGLACASVGAQPSVINIYSARHYPSDELLYSNFSKASGIKINRVDADDAGIIARLKAEGKASNADVVLLVDASRLWRGEIDGLFQPVSSRLLDATIPDQFRAKPNAEGRSAWFGFSTRARLIVYDKRQLKAEDVDSYEKLGQAKIKGKLCIRSGSHPYNLSLFGAMTEHLGPQKTEAWLKALVDNMARSPKGGDTDQIRAVGAGECGVAISNSYYLARMMRSGKPEDQALMGRIGVVFPNQSSWGTHINIAGGAVAKNARNVAGAIKFLEYLASAEAQEHFANGNNEWPVARGVRLHNPALQAMAGDQFKSDNTPVSVIGGNQIRVQQMLDRVGFR